MVMRSFKRSKLSIKVKKSKIDEYKKTIKKEFGDKVKVSISKGKIVVEGDGLSDYRIHDKILYILTGGEYGANI